jgi:hypothetical protein
MIFTVNGRRYDARPADAWCIAAGVEHSAEIIEDSVAVEVFSPVREDYLPYKRNTADRTKGGKRMKQFVLTPAAGKRLIAKAVARHPQVQSALESKTVVVVAGTTNGYVAEELLACVGQGGEFRKDRFFRGIILPPHRPQREDGRSPMKAVFPETS